MKKTILVIILILPLLLLNSNFAFAQTLASRLSGKILLQVEEHGEAWYVYPEAGPRKSDVEKRFYLGRPADAFEIMRELGLGISEKDFQMFNSQAPKRLSGLILLRVQAHGEAYYVNPLDLKMHYLGRPADAFRIMRELGLGITNDDLEYISIASESISAKASEDLWKEIPEIKDYPKLEQVFMDLYGYQGFKDEEIDFMNVGLKIYKENPKLKQYPKEALLYQMARTAGLNYYDAEFFEQTLIPLAQEITAGTRDDLEAVIAIQKWVDDNMIYDFFPHPYITPKAILAEKRGVCAEYAVLIAALAKAKAIPARIISSVKILNGGEGHAWVEAYINGDWIAIASTGAMDKNKDGLIELADLVAYENNKMVDVFIKSPYSDSGRDRADITFGYNNYIVEQMITEISIHSGLSSSPQAQENLEQAQNIFSSWERKKSSKERDRIGRQSMELLLQAKAMLEHNITKDEVQIAFLEDFPLYTHVWNSKEREVIPKILTGVAESATISNLPVFWEDFQKALIEENPKYLYIFDVADEIDTSIPFTGHYRGIDFWMIREIDELIKDNNLDTELSFILRWTAQDNSEIVQFLGPEDIEPVTTLADLFHNNALDFLLDFLGAVERVQDGEAQESFYLPEKFEQRYDYYITGIGPFLRENNEFIGYSLGFQMVIDMSVGEVPFRLELHRMPGDEDFPEYRNIMFVDELGAVTSPELEYGAYNYPVCPSEFVHLDGGQNIIIQREGEFVRITETGAE